MSSLDIKFENNCYNVILTDAHNTKIVASFAREQMTQMMSFVLFIIEIYELANRKLAQTQSARNIMIYYALR